MVTIGGADSSPTNLSKLKGANREEVEVVAIVMQLKSVEGAEKESVVAKLKSAVGEQFDQRQIAKLKELQALEEQLARLKEIHSKRTQLRDQIIGDRVQQLIREVDGLGWGTDVQERSIFGRTDSAFEEISLFGGGGVRAPWTSPPLPPAKPATLERRATRSSRD